MRLYSYVVAYDYGFAPNPFYGVCSLATCKPQIRRTADIGDWIIGTGSARHDRRGYLVYVMEVSRAMTFTDYWNATRFRRKRPILRGSKKQAFGDNIYWQDESRYWHQADSHHSLADGRANVHNLRRDTGVDRVLVGERYTYWGGGGPRIPAHIRSYQKYDLCAVTQGHKCRFPQPLVDQFLDWYWTLDVFGYCGRPTDWNPHCDGFPPGGLVT